MSNREAVLAVTGSIAAYKGCEIASRLVEMGVCVTPVLTQNALEFVGRASFEAITGNRVITNMFEPIPTSEIEHIAVATRAHLFLVAPASADILAKAAHGIADDWLSTTLLATRAPVLFAPAMNSNMYTHPATQANIALLHERGCHFVGPGAGRLACGTLGVGRMIDPAAVLEAALPLLAGDHTLKGRNVLITSGGTREPIDPVRYIGNRSSGKMGRALALAALLRGAQVTVVSGPSEVSLPYGVETIPVETALDMAEAVAARSMDADVFIAAAAVADYRVQDVAAQKRKRTGEPVEVRLLENPDILAEAAAKRRAGQVFVGFAAETENLEANARAKLERKGLDMVVANCVGTDESGFGTDGLQASLISREGDITSWDAIDKSDLADEIMDRIAALLG